MSGAATSHNEIVLRYLQDHPGTRIAMPFLVNLCGGYAIHSRISDLRKRGYQIENSLDRSSKPYKSYYRLLA